MEGALRLSLAPRPAHGGDRCALGRSRLPAPAVAAMGALGAQAAALVLGEEAKGVHCRFLRVIEAHLREHSPNSGDSIRNSWTWRVTAVHPTADPSLRSPSVCRWPRAVSRLPADEGLLPVPQRTQRLEGATVRCWPLCEVSNYVKLAAAVNASR